jgi:SAM-dependent methyltransferase
VLEVASGTGEHAVFFAGRLPDVHWQPSDPDADHRASVASWIAHAGLANIAAPLPLDATDDATWPDETFDAVFNANMIHISPWAACEGLLRGASRVLRPGGVLVTYGPYMRGGQHTAPSNAAFDASLRARHPEWGVRDLDTVVAAATARDLRLTEVVEMPANNLCVVFERR